MNKKLIPFAVAAALTAPLAAQAEVTIYGKANVSYDAVKCDGDKRHYKITSNQPEGCGAFLFDENGDLVTSSFYGPEGRASRPEGHLEDGVLRRHGQQLGRQQQP